MHGREGMAVIECVCIMAWPDNGSSGDTTAWVLSWAGGSLEEGGWDFRVLTVSWFSLETPNSIISQMSGISAWLKGTKQPCLYKLLRYCCKASPGVWLFLMHLGLAIKTQFIRKQIDFNLWVFTMLPDRWWYCSKMKINYFSNVLLLKKK